MTTSDAGPAGARGDHQPPSKLPLVLALVGGNFVGFSLLLTAVPVVGRAYGLGSAALGAVLAVVVGLGMVVDAPVSGWVARFGTGRVVAGGALVSAAACVLVVVWQAGSAVVVASPLLGLGNALLLNPLLAALASAAGSRHLVTVQLANAGVQRLGALVSAGAVALLFGVGDGAGLFVVCAVAFPVLAIAARGLPTPPAEAVPSAITTYRRCLHVLHTSGRVQMAAVLNVVITTLVVTGASFLPLLLEGRGVPGLAVGAVLAAREVVAIGSAAWLARRPQERNVVALVVVTGVVGAVALMAGWWTRDTLLVGVLFAVHGLALCTCIAATNLHTVEGTDDAHRLYGFAATGLANRSAGIVVPLILGWLLGRFGAAAAVFAGGGLALVGIAAYVVLAGRRSPSMDTARLEAG